MTTTTTNTAPSTCPNWCVSEMRPDDRDELGNRVGGGSTMHFGADVEGEATGGRWVVGFAQDGDQPPTIQPQSDGDLTSEQARAYALALLEASLLVKRRPSTGRVARRIAERLTAEELPLDTLEAVADALGVDVLDLLMVQPERS